MQDYDTFGKLIEIQGFSVSDMNFIDGEVPEIRIYLKRDEEKYRCSRCKEYYMNYYDKYEYLARDLPYGKWKKSWLIFDQMRVNCPNCGVVVEALEWKDKYARYTKRLAEEIARECRLIQSIKQVAERFILDWGTVKEIDKKYLEKELNPPDFNGVEYIAVDEFSIEKKHKYATVIVEAIRKRVLWVVKDRKKESLEEFYKALGKEGCKKIKAVAMDMWQPYEQATKEYCPDAEIVYDGFHIIASYGRVIDEVRNEEIRKSADAEKEIIKGSKYLLLANRSNVTGKYRTKLKELLSLNKRINTVYVLKDDLKHLWNYNYEKVAKEWFKGWYKRAIYSKIEPLKKFARSLKEHFKGILAHCRHKLNTSFLEGMNNKIKVIKRVAYGFRDMEYFFLKIRGAFAKKNIDKNLEWSKMQSW